MCRSGIHFPGMHDAEEISVLKSTSEITGYTYKNSEYIYFCDLLHVSVKKVQILEVKRFL